MAVRFQTSAANYQSRSSDLLSYNAAYTWMAWCYLESDLDAAQAVFVIRNTTGTEGDIIVTPSAGVGVYVSVNGGGGSSVQTWAAGTWAHLTMCRSTSSSLDLYVNGVYAASDTTAAGTGRTVSAMESGSVLSGAANRWDGRKYAEKAWSAALSAAEIANEMRTIRPQRWANLYAWWPAIHSAAADAAKDFSGNGRDWTNNGTIAVADGASVSYGAWINQGRPVIWTYARPASDISEGWSLSTGADSYALLDETTANDSDYIYATAASQTTEVKLGTMSTPQTSTSLLVNYRIQGIAGGSTVTVSLYCGATLIKTDTTRSANGDYTMTVAYADWDTEVTDWSDMRLRFVSG